MSKIPTSTEQELGKLVPCCLDEDFLSRLTACAEGTLTELTAEELEMEKQLRAVKPRAIPSSLQEKLSSTISDTPFAVDDKIVLFHKSNPHKTRHDPAKRSNLLRFNIAAAAAVAILGSIAALMTPGREDHAGQIVRQETIAPVAPDLMVQAPQASPVSNFSPASFNRNLSNTQDEGVIWQNNNQPHRVLRFTYTDQVTMTNENGEQVQVEQPRVEYVIIPEKID
ncbi:hypothetical protein ACFSSA_08170 [Luteolibacter algae]|uniref:Anti sigma-E protein RseA N-terminal domain-containing protein n=1 Tax=Luteolibacter algae TaxID=454151 RepID=A0ABW5D6C5_9BACT